MRYSEPQPIAATIATLRAAMPLQAMPPSAWCALSMPIAKMTTASHRDDDHGNRKREQEQHAARLAARLVLVGEEVHVAVAG